MSHNLTRLLQECQVDPGGLSQAHQLLTALTSFPD